MQCRRWRPPKVPDVRAIADRAAQLQFPGQAERGPGSDQAGYLGPDPEHFETSIAEAESPDPDRIQHQLGLALSFCPYLATVDSSAAEMTCTGAACGSRSVTTATR